MIAKKFNSAVCNVYLYIEAEEDNIAVLHEILFAFQPDLAMLTQGSFGMVFHEVFIAVNLSPDESALKVCVDNAGALGSLHAFAECPGSALRFTDREECAQAKQMIGGSLTVNNSGDFQNMQ